MVACFRDMFRLIERNGWGMPAGIEVEQHLMSKYKEGFLKAGEVFKFVRFCAPLNSQDKYAEPLNGAFKTTIAHKNHEGWVVGTVKGHGVWIRRKSATVGTILTRIGNIIRLRNLWPMTAGTVRSGTTRCTPTRRNIRV